MFFERTKSDARTSPWRRWRDLAFATCTVWLVVQNVVLLALVVWGSPGSALAAGALIAKTAISVSGQLLVLALAVVLGLALAAWLVHVPAEGLESTTRGSVEERGVRDAR